VSAPVEFEAGRDRAYAARVIAHTAREVRAWAQGLALVLLIAAVAGFAAGGWGVFAALLALGVAAGLVYFATARRIVGRLPEHWFAPRRYTVTEESVSVDGPMGSATYRWEAVRRVRVTPDAVLLEIPPGSVVDLPVAAMTAEQLARVRALMRSRSGTMAG
jgi:hypothetical protein